MVSANANLSLCELGYQDSQTSSDIPRIAVLASEIAGDGDGVSEFLEDTPCQWSACGPILWYISRHEGQSHQAKPCGSSPLRVNVASATRYGHYQRHQELQQLPDRSRARDLDPGGASSSKSDSTVMSTWNLTPRGSDSLLIEEEGSPHLSERCHLLSENSTVLGERGSAGGQREAEEDAAPSLKGCGRKVILEKEGKLRRGDLQSEIPADLVEKLCRSTETAQGKLPGIAGGWRAARARTVPGSLLQKHATAGGEKPWGDANSLEWLKGQKDIHSPDTPRELAHLEEYWDNPELEEGSGQSRGLCRTRGCRAGRPRTLGKRGRSSSHFAQRRWITEATGKPQRDKASPQGVLRAPDGASRKQPQHRKGRALCHPPRSQSPPQRRRRGKEAYLLGPKVTPDRCEFSHQRLQAFGLNPNWPHFCQLGRQQRKQQGPKSGP
ncbi:hypothetical protein GH733_010032 [Mirounga leonina]|nr:hypothetical protein GH733_010032 [Mirounga leonina]